MKHRIETMKWDTFDQKDEMRSDVAVDQLCGM